MLSKGVGSRPSQPPCLQDDCPFLHLRHSPLAPQISLLPLMQAWDFVKEVASGTELPAGDFGPYFHVVHRMGVELPTAPCWKSHLLQQLLADREKASPALEALYLYVPGTLRPHLVTGEMTKASEFREVRSLTLSGCAQYLLHSGRGVGRRLRLSDMVVPCTLMKLGTQLPRGIHGRSQ